MAVSSRPNYLRNLADLFRVPARTPGPLGINDSGDIGLTCHLGDTPGPTGLNDPGDPSLGFFNPVLGAGAFKRALDGTLLAVGLMCTEEDGPQEDELPTVDQIDLPKAQEMALQITTVFEGGKSMNYRALAGDFDGQGTSFGLIQWNFGQNTLGPLLKLMMAKDAAAFEKCFGPDAKFDVLKKALEDGKKDAQMNWAKDLIKDKRSAWVAAFNAIGSVDAFNRIQREQAIAKYHPLVEKAIASVRSLDSELMRKVEFRSYAALFDLCVQQNGVDKAWDAIKLRVKNEKPKSQLALLTIVVVERAKKASSAWVSDCISRRLGILTGGPFQSKEHTVTKKRDNPQFTLITESGTKVVLGL